MAATTVLTYTTMTFVCKRRDGRRIIKLHLNDQHMKLPRYVTIHPQQRKGTTAANKNPQLATGSRCIQEQYLHMYSNVRACLEVRYSLCAWSHALTQINSVCPSTFVCAHDTPKQDTKGKIIILHMKESPSLALSHFEQQRDRPREQNNGPSPKRQYPSWSIHGTGFAQAGHQYRRVLNSSYHSGRLGKGRNHRSF